MPRYRVYFTTTADTYVDVTAEDPNLAIEIAYEELPGFPYIRGISFSGEWEVDEDLDELEDE